ncbi:DUF1634 domain-containing protein [Pelosinus propionicus]|uniref:Uncharacterized membrane protein n=1 Tax=Pelosinus propionicus DSM 13327 TaxID=1123291 RepID=A0A1I4MZC6_9FIRM|nr:DUF1634 domain-containing protein [Pelosinus propionicus]SFM08320.1 Uncharacterized membrane protein [Pelosinus propionicus DSM 13327]
MSEINKDVQGSSKDINEVEIFVSKSLRFGVLLSGAVILLGLTLFLSSGEGGYPGSTYPTRLRDIFAGAFEMKPFGVILAGLVLLICTPIMRVGISALVFLKERDWLYVGISAVVFFILVSGFFFGK